MGRKTRDGKGVEVTAPSGGLTEGTFYKIDGIIGLCLLNAEEGYNSALSTEIAHYETTQIDTADTFAKGDKVYWDEGNERITTVGGAGFEFIGIVTEAKDSDNVVEFIMITQAGLNNPSIQMTATADSTASDVAGIVADFNTLLGKLRTAGVMAS